MQLRIAPLRNKRQLAEIRWFYLLSEYSIALREKENLSCAEIYVLKFSSG